METFVGATIAWGLPPYVAYAGAAWGLPRQFPSCEAKELMDLVFFCLMQGSGCRYLCVERRDRNTLIQWFSTFFEPGPTFIFKKISGPTRTTTCQKYLFSLRHYAAYYVIWIIMHKVYSNVLRCSITLLNGISTADPGYISVWFEVPF